MRSERWNRALERAGSRALFPDSDGFVSTAGGEYGGHTVDAGGWFPGEAPNPIGVTFKFLNFIQLEILIHEILHPDSEYLTLYENG